MKKQSKFMKIIPVFLVLFLAAIIVIGYRVINKNSIDKIVVFVMDGGEGDGSSPKKPLGGKIIYPYDDSKAQPYYENAALYQAADKLKETGGTIVICGEVAIGIEESYGDGKDDRDFIFPTNGSNTIKITSKYKGVDYRTSNNARLIIEAPAHTQMGGKSIWENIEICTKGRERVIACNNYITVFGEGIECTTDDNREALSKNAAYFINIAGSGRYEPPEIPEDEPTSTNLTIMSGTYGKVVGSLWGINLSRDYYVFEGNSNITIGENTTVLGGIIGSCNASNSYQNGNVNITINGGTIYGKVEGTNEIGFRNNNAIVKYKINGGDFTNCTGIYGGSRGETFYYQPYSATIDFSGYNDAEYEAASKLLAEKYIVTCKNCTANISEVILPSGENLEITPDDIGKDMLKEDIHAIRQKVVDYMYAMSQVKWIPEENFSIGSNSNYKEGETYYGMPYTTRRKALLEEFESFIIDGIYTGPANPALVIGNHCTSSILGSWARIGNSVTASYTKNLLPSRGEGALPVGSYDWKGYDIQQFTDPTTEELVESSGKQTMFEAYSLLKAADAIIMRRKTEGHGRLVSKDAVTVRNTDGTIDGEKSYVTTIEQGSNTNKKVNHKYTFDELFKSSYIPITCFELVTGLYEKPKVSISPKITASDITEKERFTNIVNSNYNVFWIKVEIIDSNDNIVYSETKFASDSLGSYPMGNFNESLLAVSLLKSGEYTYTISALVRDEIIVVDSIEFIK
jgi:hypothetical protein